MQNEAIVVWGKTISEHLHRRRKDEDIAPRNGRNMQAIAFCVFKL
jgi:hypothetical protein